jgi:flagellar hook-associated protein 2
MGISSLGIGSGLDTQAMLDQLALAEQTRLIPYTTKQNEYKAEISAWGEISSALTTLNASLKTLSEDAFNTLLVSDTKAFSATATSAANADSHIISVQQLAMAHKIKTDTYATDVEQLGEQTGGTRTLHIMQDNGEELVVTLADDETSLVQIAKAINEENGDITASVQNTDDGYQLVMTSKSTGESGHMEVWVEGDETLDQVFNTETGSMITVSDAQDAKITVDGSQYTRSSNTITDVIDGVTLTLKTVSPESETEVLTLSKDNSAVSSAVNQFVTQYNALITLTNDKSKYVPASAGEISSANGALMGDSTLRSLVGAVRSSVNSIYGEPGAEYSSLADIGISIDSATGLMTLDSSKFDQAMAENSDLVSDIFLGSKSTPGLATVLSETISLYIGDEESKTEGIIDGTVDSLNDQVEQMQKQIDRTQLLIDAEIEIYRQQFQQLDITMAQLNSLSMQMAAMMGQS